MKGSPSIGGRMLVVPVDSGEFLADSCAAVLEARGHLVERARDPAAVGGMMARSGHEVLVLAGGDPGGILSILPRLASETLDPIAIVVVGEAAASRTRDLILAGAARVVADPGDTDGLAEAAAWALRFAQGLRREARHDPGQNILERLIGSGESLRSVHEIVPKAARSRSPVLLLGEVGTGKGLVARAIHALDDGPRRHGAFVIWPLAVTGQAGPERARVDLLGTAEVPGAFELAHGGTLLLDEITLLPEALQSTLADTLNSPGRPIARSDGTMMEIDVRIMTGSSLDPREAVDRGHLRKELYDRLRSFPISLPPLRNRPEDIPIIADTLIDRYGSMLGVTLFGLTPRAMGMLQQYDWPGNIRELQEHIERAVKRAQGPALAGADLAELAHRLAGRKTPAHSGTIDVALALDDALPLSEINRRAAATAEVVAIRKALMATGGNITHAAKRLGVSRLHLQKRMKLYRLRRAR